MATPTAFPNELLRGSLLFAALLVGFSAPVSSAAEDRVTIDATKPGEPIAPLVYGQFIEHLGRCIYGGLWAEMLEDRKFFYPVTGEAPPWEMFTPGKVSWEGEGHPYELLVRSPWLVLGESKKAVSMVKERPYVGEHSPRVTLPGGGKPAGLAQERLGLEQGREYVGRIVLAGDSTAAPIEVSLAWGGGASERQTVVVSELKGEFATVPLRFLAKGTSDNGRIEIVGRGAGSFTVGTVSLMPADNVFGWRADTLARLVELDSPVYRWPGGNFVSGYDWKDGVGDRDRRPPRKNPAWKGIESNDVGLHEFMDLCRKIGTEPYVAVNTGLGGVTAAAELVQYANGAPETPMGRRRAENGHPRPYGIKYWAVGNEMYGDWQLGHMPLEKYVEKHRAMVDAMRAVDATIRPVAGIRKVAEAHRAYRREIPALKGKDIRIALDEWNYWYGGNEYGELGTRYFLQDGLGIAAGLHEMFRNSDIFAMANYAQTVNVIGAIKTTKTAAEMEPTGQVLALYRKEFGTLPATVTGVAAPLDVAAALTADRSALTVAVVNPTAESRLFPFDLRGAHLSGPARRFVLTGRDRWSWNAPGQPRGVTVEATSLAGAGAGIEAPPLSVALYRFALR